MKTLSSAASRFFPAILVFAFAPNAVAAEQNFSFEPMGPGVEYAHQSVTNIPWSIHILKIDRHRRDLKFVTTLGQGTVYGLATLTEHIDSIPATKGLPVAGINGDFFVLAKTPYQGDPRGLQIVNGELVSAPTGAVCFWLDGNKPRMEKVVSKLKVTWPDGTQMPIGLNEARDGKQAVLLTPTLGESTRTTNGVELILERAGSDWLPLRAGKTYSARVREIRGTNTSLAPDIMILSLGSDFAHPSLKTGMRLKISTATIPNLSRVETAIGGGPALIHHKKSTVKTVQASATEKMKLRNPRSAFGWNDSSFYFVVADGRRKDVSMGMTFAELAEEMSSLGCKEAMNLDGGGSSTIWAGDKVLNQPSDNHDRGLGNALVVVRKK